MDNGTWDALLRHFADLRDGTHGGSGTRDGKVRAFRTTVELIDPVVRGVLGELNHELLLEAGRVERSETDDSVAWSLSWAEQEKAGIEPVRLVAHFEPSFHHPHLRGSTVGEWPLNAGTPDEAGELAPVLRAIAAADLHNLVYRADFRIVPATLSGR